MIATAEPTEPIAPSMPVQDALFELQLRVARRADELTQGHDSSRARDLLAWFEAERNVFVPRTAHAAENGTMRQL
jgi:hypothetical protein